MTKISLTIHISLLNKYEIIDRYGKASPRPYNMRIPKIIGIIWHYDFAKLHWHWEYMAHGYVPYSESVIHFKYNLLQMGR